MMKKSECLKLAQIAVLNSTDLTRAEKLEVIDLLLFEESFQRCVEKNNEKQESEK